MKKPDRFLASARAYYRLAARRDLTTREAQRYRELADRLVERSRRHREDMAAWKRRQNGLRSP